MSASAQAGERAVATRKAPPKSGDWRDRLRRGVSFELAVFLGSLCLLLGVVPFGDFYTIVGDNIAQVGYWRILFHREFVGSVGASTMKPGLILLLGATYDLSLALLHSTILIKMVFAAAGAALLTIIARLAKEAGGHIAAAGAVIYALTATPIPQFYSTGSSMILFFPLLFAGIWWFSRGREVLGAAVLCGAALIRVEAFAVLGLVALTGQLFERRYRAFIVSGLTMLPALAVTLAIYYLVQGSVARFNAGGPNVGYVYQSTAAPTLGEVVKYLASATFENAIEDCGLPYLAIPSVAGLALYSGRKHYLSLLGIPIFLILYLTRGGGYPEARYFQFIIPLVAAFGAAGIACGGVLHSLSRPRLIVLLSVTLLAAGVASFAIGPLRALVPLSLMLITAAFAAWCRRRSNSPWPWLPHLLWSPIFATALVLAYRHGTWGEPPGLAAYSEDAAELVEKEVVPRGARVLIDDDVLYGVLIRDPRFLTSARALQEFNIQPEERRSAILAATDYVVISKNDHPWYYNQYDPLRRRARDPFRAAMNKLKRGARGTSLYGQGLISIKNTSSWLVVKVDHSNPG